MHRGKFAVSVHSLPARRSVKTVKPHSGDSTLRNFCRRKNWKIALIQNRSFVTLIHFYHSMHLFDLLYQICMIFMGIKHSHPKSV